MTASTTLLRPLVASLIGWLITAPLGAAEAPRPPDWPRPAQAPHNAPNIVLILLDDVGFAAASTFGGPVEMPHLDALASTGLRFNRFHVTALCSPTRAALLSGRNEHRVGFGTIADWASSFPGYTSIWSADAAAIPEVLRRNGYSTGAFGKWHNTPFWEISPIGPFDRWPTGLGFDYFYGFMWGEDSQLVPQFLYRNTTAVEPPADAPDYHLTTDMVDEAIGWVHTLESLAPSKPYFLYLAPGATHAPHQAPREWIERYRGRFDDGWDALRERIFARQKKLGVIPQDARLTARPEQLPAWDSFDARQQKYLARQMEIFAGFLSHTDHEIGRLLQTVREGPRGENTLVFYIVGDNGAATGGIRGGDNFSGEDRDAIEDEDAERLAHLSDLGFTDFYWNNYAGPWGWATNTPFQWGKQVASHLGGIRNPLVVSWQQGIERAGGIREQFTSVTDIAATIYEVTGISPPSSVDGIAQSPLDGISFAYAFDDAQAPSRRRMQLFEQLGNRAIYHDGWMASAVHALPWQQPFRNDGFEHDRWELYDLDADFSQSVDLAERFPKKLAALQGLFDAEAQRNRVYPLGAGSWMMAGKEQPALAKDRTHFVYYPDLPKIPNVSAEASHVPDFSRSHRIVAHVHIPEGGADGVIVSNGSRWSGFSLFVQDGFLVYTNHARGSAPSTVSSTLRIPAGKRTLQFEFERAQTVVRNGTVREASGAGTLLVDGQVVGRLSLPRVTREHLGSFSIGRASASPVTDAFAPPFEFAGTIERVEVQLD